MDISDIVVELESLELRIETERELSQEEIQAAVNKFAKKQFNRKSMIIDKLDHGYDLSEGIHEYDISIFA